MPSPYWLYSVERPVREPLLVAQFHAREVEHAVLHGAEHLLAAAGADALIERGDDAEARDAARCRESPICAPVTSGGPSRKPVVEAAPPAHCATFS